MAEQIGKLLKAETGDDDDAILRTTGFYQYIGDDGKQYRVDYVADVNGFVAKVNAIRAFLLFNAHILSKIIKQWNI